MLSTQFLLSILQTRSLLAYTQHNGPSPRLSRQESLSTTLAFLLPPQHFLDTNAQPAHVLHGIELTSTELFYCLCKSLSRRFLYTPPSPSLLYPHFPLPHLTSVLPHFHQTTNPSPSGLLIDLYIKPPLCPTCRTKHRKWVQDQGVK